MSGDEGETCKWYGRRQSLGTGDMEQLGKKGLGVLEHRLKTTSCQSDFAHGCEVVVRGRAE